MQAGLQPTWNHITKLLLKLLDVVVFDRRRTALVLESFCGVSFAHGTQVGALKDSSELLQVTTQRATWLPVRRDL